MTATSDSIEVHVDTVLYKHGFNRFSLPNAATGETVDSVMIGAIDWRYFALADSMYNVRYYKYNYLQTDSTRSYFEWTFPAAASASAHQKPNQTGTSPHISVDWTDKSNGIDSIFVVEFPRQYDSIVLPAGACQGDSLIIPVQVLDRPNVMFDSLTIGRVAVSCTVISASAPHVFGFPLVKTDTIPPKDRIIAHTAINETANGEMYITYTVEKMTSGAYSPIAGFSPRTDTIVIASLPNGSLPVAFTEYGAYRITILSVSNSIAEKCDVQGLVPKRYGRNRFLYSIAPPPQNIDVNHVKNICQ